MNFFVNLPVVANDEWNADKIKKYSILPIFIRRLIFTGWVLAV